jgi:hypothetical protein
MKFVLISHNLINSLVRLIEHILKYLLILLITKSAISDRDHRDYEALQPHDSFIKEV